MDIPLFLKLLYVKQVKNYYLYKTDQGECLPHLFLMEYNASRMLDKKLKLSHRYSILHAFTPSEFYNRFLHVLDSHNLGKNEIETMNARQIYYTIIEQRRSQRLIPFVPFSIPNSGVARNGGTRGGISWCHPFSVQNYVKTKKKGHCRQSSGFSVQIYL